MAERISENLVVVGLGYVGLPLAVAFSTVCDNLTGYDVNNQRVADLRNGYDYTGETDPDELKAHGLKFTSNADCLIGAKYIIVTVPTPTDKGNRPDLGYLRMACETIGKYLEPNSIIIFESTVYPTATEEFCGSVIERVSGLKCGVDFKLGYSPERINPGDKEHSLTDIKKVVSGQDAETLELVAALYERIIRAGVHKATSITVAEASKVLENTQRDLNIALMNELALICDLLDISTMHVIDAAATKWNFLRFTPGLVGGHCIGVDPYYLTAKAEELGYHPDVILAGRRINDQMANFISQRIVKLLAVADLPVRSARIGILGLTFKENVPDFRNSKVIDIINEMNAYGIKPFVHDPYFGVAESFSGSDFQQVSLDEMKDLHCLVLAVPHEEYLAGGVEQFTSKLIKNGVFVDIKSQIPSSDFDDSVNYWSL